MLAYADCQIIHGMMYYDMFWFHLPLGVDQSKYFWQRWLILCNIAYVVLVNPWLGFQSCIWYIRCAKEWIDYGWEVNCVRSVCEWFASRFEFVVMRKLVWEELWSWYILLDSVLWQWRLSEIFPCYWSLDYCSRIISWLG